MIDIYRMNISAMHNRATYRIAFIVPVILFMVLHHVSQAQADWKEINTVEEVCSAYPDKITAMLESFDLELGDLKAVKQAYDRGDISMASEALLDYYRNCGNAMHLRQPQPLGSKKTVALADTILNNVFVIQNVRGQVPFGTDGHRDWDYKGPNNDREWAWLSNRHSQISEVFEVYLETGNPKYSEYIDLFLRDFIIKSMPYPGVKSSTSVWRGLEVSFRAKVWTRVFYGLLSSEYLSPATRLLILSSLPDHAHYNRNFHGENNWLTMEISALATVAANFPEYRKANEWFEYSIRTMAESMKIQVYPDGVQTELTSHYHNVSLRNFALFQEICDRAGRELPDFYDQTIEDMYSYIAHAMRPDGNRILNNDGDKGSDRELILEGAKKYKKPEWEFIATNGEKGTSPPDGPSWFYPWAGQLISRSGYDKDAHWSFFDIGPWGSGHQHNDKMHLSVSAFGRDLLVDGGRFAYTGEVAEKFRPYARGSHSHNVILVDGEGQAPGPELAEESLSVNHCKIIPDYDYAWGSFDNFIEISGNFAHNRALLYVRGRYWIVVDRITSDRPRKVDVLWHWHPDCQVIEQKGRIVTSANDRGNLAVIPISKQKWSVNFIEGQEEPEIQGWFSEEYNKFEPNVASIYSARIKSASTFVWLLQPFEKEREKLKVKVLEETDEAVKVQINEKTGNHMILTVPYSDSSLVNIMEK